jgi:hypothetical protein
MLTPAWRATSLSVAATYALAVPEAKSFRISETKDQELTPFTSWNPGLDSRSIGVVSSQIVSCQWNAFHA